jgi:DNA repair exonuclease SbcCD ATPase subunit|mmetsp:Transcript_100316/g.158712  ORF Transcript_100316/g.158712 Transcript_100316/m.158712 type:complete len:681 (-) Transcript_100316:80-2122(-)
MQAVMLGLLFALTFVGLAEASLGSVAVTPVQKAVQLLDDMLVKAEAGKHEENVQFAGFKQFCDDVTVQKQKDISDADGQIDLLKADIEKADSEAERLGTEIRGHHTDIDGWNKDKTDATTVRESERATYLEEHRDYTESIQAIEQAIIVLKNQNFDRPAVSFLQKVSVLAKTPQDVRKTIESFLATVKGKEEPAPDPDDNLGYKATAYSFQSGAVIDMLEKLQVKFKDEATTLEKDEVSRRQAYDMVLQNLADQTKDAENSIEEKTVTLAKQKQLSIEKTAELSEVTTVRDSDAKYLSDLESLCKQKSTEFEARTKLRQEEIEALTKAKDILQSEAVSDAKQHVSGYKASSFAQLRAVTSSPNQARALDFLLSESQRLGSSVLSSLAMEARSDPFGKVKKLIQELITRLMQEATNEAEHKGWCDKELATNKHTRETKTAEVDNLRSSIEGLDADIASLTKDITKKTEEVEKIEADVAEFTSKRNNETATNAITIKEAQEGQAAIQTCIKVLKDFYSKAAEAKSLVQTAAKARQGQQPEIPEIFEGEFKGQQSANGGVIGMLEVIQSDFERLESDTKSAEQAAQNEYDEFMSDSEQAKASLDVDLKNAKSTKLAKEGELGVAKENLGTAEKTLESANAYYEKLKEPCLGGGQTYADRKARRKDEIEALKQALEILEGASSM